MMRLSFRTPSRIGWIALWTRSTGDSASSGCSTASTPCDLGLPACCRSRWCSWSRLSSKSSRWAFGMVGRAIRSGARQQGCARRATEGLRRHGPSLVRFSREFRECLRPAAVRLVAHEFAGRGPLTSSGNRQCVDRHLNRRSGSHGSLRGGCVDSHARTGFACGSFFQSYRHQEKVSPLVRQSPCSHHPIVASQCKLNEEGEFSCAVRLPSVGASGRRRGLVDNIHRVIRRATPFRFVAAQRFADQQIGLFEQ